MTPALQIEHDETPFLQALVDVCLTLAHIARTATFLGDSQMAQYGLAKAELTSLTIVEFVRAQDHGQQIELRSRLTEFRSVVDEALYLIKSERDAVAG